MERRPAGAFESANRDVERSAAARSKSSFGYLGLTPGFAIATPGATFLNRYAIPCTYISACVKKTFCACIAGTHCLCVRNMFLKNKTVRRLGRRTVGD